MLEAYVHSMTDTEFEELHPFGQEYESAEELKWMFNVSHSIALGVLNQRRDSGQITSKAAQKSSMYFDTKSAKKPLKDPKGGLTAAGRAYFKRTQGANLKPGVRGPADTPDKLRRKGSFLTRFFTNPSGPMKKPNGKPSRLALSAAAWGEPVPQNAEDAAALAAKGRRLLERYQNRKNKKK